VKEQSQDQAMRFFRMVAALGVGLAVASCSTPVPEIDLPPVPLLPPAPTIILVNRHVQGQVFWITEGGDVVKVSGANVMFYDADYLVTARETIVRYANQDFDTTNNFYAGAPGRIMRAKFRLQNNVDLAWSSLTQPVAIVVADADGRFEHTGPLPQNIGIYCDAGRRTRGDLERIRWALTESQFTAPSRMIMTNDNRLK
jgi:hypothetical protein